MAAQPTVHFSVFQGVVSGLFSLLVILVGVIYHGLSGDLTEAKQIGRDNTKAIGDLRVELVTAVGGVEKQAVVTNQKLDDLLGELRRAKPH